MSINVGKKIPSTFLPVIAYARSSIQMLEVNL